MPLKPFIQSDPSDNLASMMNVASETSEAVDKSSLRILIIDDNTSVLYSTRALLEANGYPCLIADGGEAGLTILEKSPLDIVLLDLSMPDIDGYTVLEAIQDKKMDVDVIIVSAEATFNNATRVFRDGAIDFLNKPYRPSQLITIIQKVAYKRDLKKRLKVIQHQLSESEKRYRFIVSNSPDIIYMIDHKGFFTFVNSRVSDLLGYQPEELIGEHFSTVIYEEDLPLAQYIFNERRTGPRASQNIELRMKCSDPSMSPKPFQSTTIVIELCSMGVYDLKEDGSPYLGTYGVARDISERKKAQEMIHFQAYHDLLTRLPNRELFLDRLNQSISQSIRNRKKLAVLFLDMDGFKFINDSLGHMVGDALLQQVAHRLQEALRDTDTVSRIGGDEFNILIPELPNREEAGLIARKILNTFNQPIKLEKHEVNIGFSIGISIFPDDAQTTGELIKNSDMAMYHVKERGKNGFEYFSDHMQSIYQHRHLIVQEIKRALDNNQFEAFYQPQFDIITGQIVGLEALIRWNHPEKGLINPDIFIAIAEEMGMISEIGLFMLETGCRQIKSWVEQHIQPVKLSINVSAFQLVDSNFDVMLCDMIKQYELPQDLLTVEITETLLMQDMDKVLPRLKHLSECGIGICIDDFGVGYSSLSYLQTLPVDILKIDRSFLAYISSDTKQSSIINAIVAMARELGIQVIVEGVETQPAARLY